MRNFPDRCVISGGRTAWLDVPCWFNFLDAVKSEALFGAQESKGSLFVPLYVNIPEEGRALDSYRVVMVRPHHPRIDQPMLIDTVKWTRIHLSMVLSIPNVA